MSLSATNLMTKKGFWDASNYLQQGGTIHCENYVNLLDIFNDYLEEKATTYDPRKVVSNKDNARMYICLVAMAKFKKMGEELSLIRYIFWI